MPLDSRYIFRLPTPSTFLSPAEKIERLTQDANRLFDALGVSFRNLTGLSGLPIHFSADLDMETHRITNMGQPIANQDSATKRYVDELIAELRKILDEILRLIHNEIPAPGLQTILLRRAVPTVVADTIEIGNFKLTNDAHNLDIAITVSDTGFSVAKAWRIVTNRSINTDWQEALALVDTGVGSSQDFALDVKQTDADSTLYLRLRRVAGTTAGTATIQMLQRGVVGDLFNETKATASVTAPTTFLESAVLTEVDGRIGIGVRAPVTGVHLAKDTYVPSLFLSEVAESSSNPAGYIGRKSRGTLTARVLPNSGDIALEWRSQIFDNGSAYNNTAAIKVLVDGTPTATSSPGVIVIYTTPAGSVTMVERERVDNQGNHGFAGAAAFGTSAAGVASWKNGTVPSTSPVDQFQLYSADQVAGNAAPTFRTENGAVIILYKETALTAASGGALSSGGAAVLSTADSTILANAITRLGELETRLKNIGLLT